MAENTFPSYKVDFLVQFIRSDILTGQEAKHFTKNDITPTTKVTLDENIQYPMLHEGVTPIMSLYLRMCNFLPVCHVYDFQLNDLLNPKAKRTIYILSGIINFLQFRKVRLDMTSEYQQSFRADMDRWQAYNRGVKELEKKIEKLTTIPPEQQAEAKELAAALTEIHSATTHEYQEANALNQQVAEWKTEIAERSQKVTQRKLEVATLKNDIAKLKSQIVESPEELRSEMEKLKDKVKTIKNSKEDVNARLVEWQIKVQAVHQNKADFQLLNKVLQDLEVGMDKMNSQQEKIQTLSAECEKMKKELKNLVTEEGQMKRALEMKMDKLSKQQIRRQKKREMKDQLVQNVLGQYNQVHQKREEIVEQIEEVNRETQQIKARIQALRDVCSLETDKAQGLYEHLLSALDNFHKRIEHHVVQGNEDIVKMKAHY
uniref:UF2 component of NDC80 kinetochore complex n=1 Tax=Scleropages formosus TaxID=113540 RepID=A0A8C9QRL5_SCLFO